MPFQELTSSNEVPSPPHFHSPIPPSLTAAYNFRFPLSRLQAFQKLVQNSAENKQKPQCLEQNQVIEPALIHRH